MVSRSLDKRGYKTYLAEIRIGAGRLAERQAWGTLSTAMSIQLGHIQLGNVIEEQYMLERQLGAGGMGTVWVARDLRLSRSVAIKFLSGDFCGDEPARQRFEREARMVSKIRSPHVVQVFAAGITADGVPYVVMELLDGEDLAARLERGGPCSLVEAGVIIEQVCRALSRSHREGLVHRDIKPHNIFLIPETGGQVFIKLLDFGIAKDTGVKATTLTVTGAVVGSVFYISPEQLRDAPSVDHQADLWALGVVIYQMLTGHMPFDGDSLPELLLRIAECRYVPATRVNPGLPPEIDGFLSRAITPDRARRFANAEELARAFAHIVRGHSSGLVRKPEHAAPVQAALPPPMAALQQPPSPGASTRAPAPRAIPSWLWAAALALLLAAGAYYGLRSEPGAARESAPLVRPAQPSAAPAASEARGQETSIHGALHADAPALGVALPAAAESPRGAAPGLSPRAGTPPISQPARAPQRPASAPERLPSTGPSAPAAAKVTRNYGF